MLEKEIQKETLALEETELEKNKKKHYPIRQEERAERPRKTIRNRPENFSINIILLVRSIDDCFRYLENYSSTPKEKIKLHKDLQKSLPELTTWIRKNDKKVPENVINILQTKLKKYSEKVIQLNRELKDILEAPYIQKQRPLLYMSPDYSTEQVQTDPEYADTLPKQSKKEKKYYTRYCSN